MDYLAALEHLESLINYEARPRAGRLGGLSLETMEQLMSVLGEPHRAYPVIHVTGTNGKGSTVRMIARLLQSMGLRVGAYTSPHLEEPTERIEVDAVPIATDAFGASVGEIASLADFLSIRATWFETVTAAALSHFADVAVDAAVVEVGMLGRFDATNVVDGAVAVVTNVGLDHSDGIGDWRHAIAHEKAGIIKPSSVVVCGETDTAVRDVFRAEPSQMMFERGLHFGVARERLAVGGRLVDFTTPHGRYEDVLITQHGRHQTDNASLALAAVEAFFDAPLPDDVVTEAMAETTIPGRFEIVGRQPLVVLDGAHNPDGARAAIQTLTSDFAPLRDYILVVGMQSGRDLVDLLEALGASNAKRVVACTAPTSRGVPAAELAAAASTVGATAEVCEDPAEALNRAQSLAASDDAIMLTGSFTVVGAAKAALTKMNAAAKAVRTSAVADDRAAVASAG